LTASESVGVGTPASLAYRMAATRRPIVEGLVPDPACAARKAATVSGGGREGRNTLAVAPCRGYPEIRAVGLSGAERLLGLGDGGRQIRTEGRGQVLGRFDDGEGGGHGRVPLLPRRGLIGANRITG
jgi:hypothetical protein